MNNVLNRIKNYEGSILGIGIKEQKLKDAIWKNKRIYTCDLLEDEEEISGKSICYNIDKKTVQIKKLYQAYGKNKIDYILCNIENMNRFLPYIWRDAFYIGKKEICFYGKFTEEDASIFMQKCKRYNVKIEQIKEKNYLFFFMKKASIPRYKSYLYFWFDKINLFLDKISEILEQ